jgi:hypothetical protein
LLAKLAAAAGSQVGDEQSLKFTKLSHPSKMATRHPKRFACGFVSDGSQPARPFAYDIEFDQLTPGEAAGSGTINSGEVGMAMQERAAARCSAYSPGKLNQSRS